MFRPRQPHTRPAPTSKSVPIPLSDLCALNRLSPALFTNSHRIIFFAHPHPLTPIESYSCKNRGVPPAPLRPSRLHPHIAPRRTATPANLFSSWAYFTILWIPRGWGPCALLLNLSSRGNRGICFFTVRRWLGIVTSLLPYFFASPRHRTQERIMTSRPHEK
jgi:hypothetical protein